MRLNITSFFLAIFFACFFHAKAQQAPKELKAFNQVVPAGVVAKAGLFNVYEVKNKVYFEVPDSLLGREMLLASRIAQVSDPSKAYAGEMRRSPLLFFFSRHENMLFMHTNSLNITVGDNQENLRKAFDRHSIKPVFQTFPIECISNNNGYLIDVTRFFSEEIPIITPFASKGKPGKLEADASYISKIQVFKNNIELQTYLNYSTTTQPFRALVNRSILLLPIQKMTPRLSDRRMNYYDSGNRILNESGEPIVNASYISRFRLEPKPQDREKYFAGQLVEPEKPIVFYVDNGFPELWRKYIKAGIEDWQKAFEAIGFKNAIIALDYPSDSTFNPDDLRYNCFRYVTNLVANAMGTRWVDPRTGEIITADVFWFHNVTEKLHDWRLIQCGAVEEGARKREFDEQLMGRLIRYAAAHEIGHSLGMEHNMRASYAYPVDSLRSPSFTEKYGTTPSIMDYARSNYIAQPGDGVTQLSPPLLGLYDIFAVKVGYQLIEGVTNPADEYNTINEWFLEHADDPIYRYCRQFALGISPDPAAQAEALGDNAIMAGNYGVKNAQFVMNHLVEWCTENGRDYDYLKRIYEELVKQYERYIEHATSCVGGAYQYLGVEGENVPLFEPLPVEEQLQAADWIIRQISNNDWILNREIEARLGSLKKNWVELNVTALDNLMNGYILLRIQTNNTSLSIEEYLDYLGEKIWQLGNDKDGLTEMDIILQQSFVRNLKSISMTLVADKPVSVSEKNPESESQLVLTNSSKTNYADYFAVMAARAGLKNTVKMARKLRKQNKEHYEYLISVALSN